MEGIALTTPTFRDLGVLPETADALEAVGIIHPFPIQEMTLPIALLGNDLIGQARTGTGKTLAFCIPLLQRISVPTDRDYEDLVLVPGKPQALVVAPTRELAIQVAGDLELAGKRRSARVLTVYGGRAYEPQIEALRKGVDAVVGTPGRLLDLANQGYLDLSHVKVLVLDEADEMLDLGFLPDVEKLISRTPELRQTMLFSATMPAAVISLARKYLRHPMNVRAEGADESAVVPLTAQFVYRVHAMDKLEMIARILQAENRGLSMIFSKTKRTCQRIADDLAERGFAVASVHGDLGQGAREQALRAFRAGKVDVLVATDVAARGIDVEGVTHVINYQCPEDEKTYLHRIGRTGRAGASGVAITFVDWDDLARWRMINTALNLPYPEPEETYSNSPQIFHDFGIPPGTTGVLPRASQTRAGLGAETLEDLGETGRSRPRTGGSGSGSGSGGSGGRGGRGGRGGSSDDSRRPPRERTRTRSADAPAPDAAVGAVAAVDAPREPGAQRTRNRKRTRAGQSLGAAGTETGAAGSDEGSAGAAVATDVVVSPDGSDSQSERRRRRRRSRGGAGGSEGAETNSTGDAGRSSAEPA